MSCAKIGRLSRLEQMCANCTTNLLGLYVLYYLFDCCIPIFAWLLKKTIKKNKMYCSPSGPPIKFMKHIVHFCSDICVITWNGSPCQIPWECGYRGVGHCLEIVWSVYISREIHTECVSAVSCVRIHFGF